MKNEFPSFIDFIEDNFKKCPWTGSRKIEDFKKEVIDEANEVAKAIDNKDYDNLKEEIGDLLWDTITLAKIAEKEGHFNSEDILKEIKKKINRRKPYLETGEKVTVEEAVEIWKKVKEQEKADKNK